MARLRDVFVPGGQPKYTYQPREKFGIEHKLADSLNRLRKFISVAGPTKCGKTVLVRKLVPRETSLWIEGSQIRSADEAWAHIAASFGVATSKQQGSGQETESSENVEVKPSFAPGGIGLSGNAGITNREKKSTTVVLGSNPPLVKVALDVLREKNPVLVIDDFHFLSASVQTDLIRALKQPVFDGLQVILLLIPHRMHQAARAEMDVDGRTHTIQIPEWELDELESIANTGFRELNVYCDRADVSDLADESFKSPHLMQDFCSKLCSDNHVLETIPGPARKLELPSEKPHFFSSFAAHVSPETVKALRKGPDRTNRKERHMKSGGTCDTYEAVLLALQKTGSLSPVRWAELRRALQEILVDEPQQHEVTRVLEKMDEIAKEREGEPVIDYIKDLGELHLVDPFFRFFLKWSKDVVEG